MKSEIKSDLPIPPGSFLEEVIEDMGMTKEELSKRMDRPPAKLSKIFSGEKSITPDTAIQLELVTGVPAHIWTGLESEYRIAISRQEEEKRFEEEKKMAGSFQYNELSKRGYLIKETNPEKKVVNLRRFFGVTSLFNLNSIPKYEYVLYRTDSTTEIKKEALAAWIRMGEIEAYKTDCERFDQKKLRNIIPEIRTYTLQRPPEFFGKLKDILSTAGIAIVILPHLPKTGAHGATFWLKDKGVILLTIRRAWADIFWFSLFHEIGHIVKHGKKLFIEKADGDKENTKHEKEADEFAANVLIPKKEYNGFVKNIKTLSAGSIKEFARSVDIHPGIVVGRLQHDKYISNKMYNELRVRYTGVEQE